MKAILFLAAILLPAFPATAAFYVYVSVSGENKISIFRMDPDSGKLSHQEDVAVGGSPGSLSPDPAQKYLFASLRSTKSIASFRLDGSTGKLAHLGTMEIGINPTYVITDRTGRFLLTASYQDGKVAVTPIGEDGKLAGKPHQVLDTAMNAHCIMPDASNKFVFVPHTGPNAIFQFRFNEKEGKLSPGSMPKLGASQGVEPRHLFFHPTMNDIAYVANEAGSSVTAYKLGTSGRLSPFQTLSTLPKDFSGRNTCADVEVTPSGKFVYVSNRGHDSIAGFAVSPGTGRLRAIGQTPTEQTPRSFNVDPTGKFLYAAGQSSGKMASYRIDPQSGELQRLETYTVGKSPAWVMVVQTPD